MILIKILFIVVVLLHSVILNCEGEEVGVPECNAFTAEAETLKLNCSRRYLNYIPENWPLELQNLDPDGNVLLTFFNNSIEVITQLPTIPGARVAVNFKSNKLQEIRDDAFRNLGNLVYLDLSNNYLQGEILRSEIFQGPYEDGLYEKIALETLDLGNNRIHSLDRYLFQYTPNLTRLYLYRNPLEILDHVTILAISSATNLEVLDLSYTDIDNIPFDALRGLRRLQFLDISGNRFTRVPDSLQLVGSSLEYLTFNNNPITELDDDSFTGLSNLQHLEVAENDNLEQVKRSAFTPLKKLRVLHLCHNANLQFINHNAFRGLKNNWTLKEVYLDENSLSEIPTDLMPWSRLEVLGMTGNAWLCNCDLASIITKQKAGEKFKDGEIPICMGPMKLSGEYITNITLENCPTLDSSFTQKRGFSLSKLKPKHLLWSILGVAMVVVIGMVLGLLINTVKEYIRRRYLNKPVRYANINNTDYAS